MKSCGTTVVMPLMLQGTSGCSSDPRSTRKRTVSHRLLSMRPWSKSTYMLSSVCGVNVMPFCSHWLLLVFPDVRVTIRSHNLTIYNEVRTLMEDLIFE